MHPLVLHQTCQWRRPRRDVLQVHQPLFRHLSPAAAIDAASLENRLAWPRVRKLPADVRAAQDWIYSQAVLWRNRRRRKPSVIASGNLPRVVDCFGLVVVPLASADQVRRAELCSSCC